MECIIINFAYIKTSEITTESSLLKDIENDSSIQPINMEFVELDRLLNNDDDIDYSNDYITIGANDSSVLDKNTTAAGAVTSVTPSGNLIRNIGYYNYIKTH